MSPDLGQYRENYDKASLRRVDLAADPVTQFTRWFDEWADTGHYDPAACVLATADGDGRPSARFVLCREFDEDGFVIYTNFESHKASDLEANPRAALVFGWLEMNRQVRIEGPVALVEDAEADAYWNSRPRASRIGAWASDQSEVIKDRAELEARQAEAEQRFGRDESAGPIPRPEQWGGYRIGIERVEFWQGRPNRLHDRFLYRRSPSPASAGEANDTGATVSWQIDRLSP